MSGIFDGRAIKCEGITDEALEIIDRSRLLVFDFDGTIADTEPHQCTSYFEALRSQGIEITFDEAFFFDECRGFNLNEIWAKMFELLGLGECDVNFYEGIRRKTLLRIFDDVGLEPFEFIDQILYELAPDTEAVVVTSDELEVVDPLLIKWGIRGRFSSVDARCPENHLSKIERLQLYSEQGDMPVVLEDSQRWLDVARDYGMMTIGVCSATRDLEADGLIFV